MSLKRKKTYGNLPGFSLEGMPALTLQRQRAPKPHETTPTRPLLSGDFWDERGALPVEPLNRILSELSGWTQPMLMLVGNHDQV